MLAFAHSDTHNAFLHWFGDIATSMALVALMLALAGLVSAGMRQRAKGTLFHSLIALVFVSLSFWNGGVLAIFFVASLLALAFSLLAISYLIRLTNSRMLLPRAFHAV